MHVPGEEPLRLPSSDATLSGLALSGVNIGAFDPATSDYTASVGNHVTETTVTATANDGGATYSVKLGGAADADGTVDLAVGDNAISVVVTAEDGDTTKTYTVTVNRAGPPLTARFEEAPQSHNGTDPFTFRIAFSEPISTSYAVVRDHALEVTGGTVAAAGRVDGRNDLWWVRVQPDSDADVTIALPADRACDTQGAVCTADEKVLSNRLELTVVGPQPTLSSDATLIGLALSGVNVGAFDPATTDYTASAENEVTETTVTATANDDGATYAVKLGGVEDADGTVEMAVGANAISVVVTAEDGQTTNIYTVTVTRAGPPLTAEFQEAPATHDGTDPFTLRIAFSEPISTSYVVVRDHALEVTGGTVSAAGRVDGRNDLWWVRVQPDSDADVTVALPANRACDTQGAVCTADEKVLSNRPELTIPGPTPANAPVNSPATGAPTINGTVQVGQTLTADTSGIADADGLSNATFAYQWIANDGSADADIPGATYTLAADDAGKTVKVRVSFTDDGGNGESLTSAATDEVTAAPAPNTPATGAPTISGTAQVGEALTANASGIADADGLDNVSFSYQWLADDAAIAGATGLTYTLVAADEGKAVKVEVTFTDDSGNDETLTSAATSAVSAANIPATGAPTISGIARVGEVLTVDTSGMSDEDGMESASFSFTWGASGYFRATGAVTEYTIQPDDKGKRVDVTAYFTDDKGNTEIVDSAPTSVVEARSNSPATGAPTISGTAQVGETLTADASGIADADGLSGATFSYQWIANDGSADTDISGATAATYTLAAAEEGKTVKVRVTFTDDGGNGESLTSAATGAVAPPPSTDATLSGLTLSGINIGAFDSATTDYTASVENDVTETTVTATANDGRATYVVKLDGVADADGVIPLAVGDNAVSVVVTAEDGQTTRTYTVTVTRAEATAPSAPVTVTLSPRPEQSSTGTDITVEWTDAEACGDQYFVGVYDNEELEVVVRVLGYHPAPATTTLSADLGLPWDRISSYDWWVGVTCTSQWTLVGKASLQSGLPSDSENG